jgi:hypothetical protein
LRHGVIDRLKAATLRVTGDGVRDVLAGLLALLEVAGTA